MLKTGRPDGVTMKEKQYLPGGFTPDFSREKGTGIAVPGEVQRYSEPVAGEEFSSGGNNGYHKGAKGCNYRYVPESALWRWRDAKHRIRWAFHGIKSREARVSPWAAQGIEAEIPQQSAKRFARNCSGKPGFLRREAPQKMRPNSSSEKFLIPHFSFLIFFPSYLIKISVIQYLHDSNHWGSGW
jgi:hypothetical protein